MKETFFAAEPSTVDIEQYILTKRINSEHEYSNVLDALSAIRSVVDTVEEEFMYSVYNINKSEEALVSIISILEYQKDLYINKKIPANELMDNINAILYNTSIMDEILTTEEDKNTNLIIYHIRALHIYAVSMKHFVQRHSDIEPVSKEYILMYSYCNLLYYLCEAKRWNRAKLLDVSNMYNSFAEHEYKKYCKLNRKYDKYVIDKMFNYN